MSEITKLYKNAGVGYLMYVVDTFFPPVEYPQIDFNEKKQLELIKLLAKNDNIYITYYPFDNTYNIRYCITGFHDGSVMGDKEVMSVEFKEALAGLINNLWQDLTEEDKEAVRGILRT